MEVRAASLMAMPAVVTTVVELRELLFRAYQKVKSWAAVAAVEGRAVMVTLGCGAPDGLLAERKPKGPKKVAADPPPEVEAWVKVQVPLRPVGSPVEGMAVAKPGSVKVTEVMAPAEVVATVRTVLVLVGVSLPGQVRVMVSPGA